MMQATTITTADASAYRQAYGIVRESETVHYFSGRGIHNRHHAHRLRIWENRPQPDGSYLDPSNRRSTDAQALLWAPQAAIIAAEHVARDPVGADLVLGQLVEVEGQLYRIAAHMLHNPHCEPLPYCRAHDIYECPFHPSS